MGVDVDLTVIWAFIIAFAVFAYVVMDGFDLGIGVLFPTFEPGQERDQAMNSIAPVWDGNETWLVLAALLLRSLGGEGQSLPFWLSIALFLLGMAGLGLTIWPNVVPPDVSIWDAAAPQRSQTFMLVGVAITMPLILAYTAWAYWVFRGKVGTEGYH